MLFSSKHRHPLELIVLLFVGYFLGWFIHDYGHQEKLDSLWESHTVVLEEISMVRVENSSLSKALKDAGSHREALLDELASLRNKPEQIRYITTVETITTGSEELLPELPGDYTYRLDNGLPVALFEVQDPLSYRFETGDLSLKVDLVVGEKAAASVRASSSLEPGVEYELKIKELNVKQIRTNQQKLFEPHILLGGGLSAGTNADKVFGPEAHIGGTFVHLPNDWDLAQVRIGISNNRPTIGFDPVIYNSGKHLPVFTNLWTGVGISYSTTGPSATITVGAKL